MNSDSDESSYEDDSPPNFAFSPDFSVRASPIVNGGGGRGKRKVGLPSSRYHQVLSARGLAGGGGVGGGGGCLDAAGEIYSEHPRKRRKGPQTNTPDNSTSSSSSDRSFACPYYKNDPVKHSSCAEWNKKDIHRVKYVHVPARSLVGLVSETFNLHNEMLTCNLYRQLKGAHQEIASEAYPMPAMQRLPRRR